MAGFTVFVLVNAILVLIAYVQPVYIHACLFSLA